MREIHEIIIDSNKYNDIITKIVQYLILKKETYKAQDYILLRKSEDVEITTDSQLVMVTAVRNDENIKEGYEIVEFRNI